MSYRELNWAWSAELPMTQKFVLVALADMADERGSCYPGQERLAQMTGTSVTTVRRAVKELEALGAITRQARGVPGGGRTSDRYVLNTNRSICTVRGNRSSEEPKPVNDDTETGQIDRGTTSRTISRTTSTSSDHLDELWELWPASRRSTRKVVEKSLRAALKVAPWSVIHAAAVTHSHVWRTWPTSELQYVPMLSTWLNQERWTATAPMPRGAGRGSTLSVGHDADRLLAEQEQLAVGGVR